MTSKTRDEIEIWHLIGQKNGSEVSEYQNVGKELTKRLDEYEKKYEECFMNHIHLCWFRGYE